MQSKPNYITPNGLQRLKERYHHLMNEERPKIVEIVSWAAGNGDRSENGDYIYGRKKMREIDRELSWLARRLKAARVVNPAEIKDRSKIWFGAKVVIADEEDNQRTVILVGEDEADASQGLISWQSPLARALRGGSLGDLRRVRLPSGEKEWEVVEILYP
ncbi:MAG: transcription elongation factor GreB [Zymomonas mobilis subsp. pomaceae]|uniref:Transcription elongation factor GreB n=1 Tax=Zymomonas mobilis subsp. pomaceae (strain ATCC 29192 / DSM 22645 / JCM 10191 / CCUG 17912 / NBRC 13757 / NCIMB 11200 / NRRL B-4491 / Barker I) TaxID=579138 RepID=F8EVU6_ZYMMT|nr:transcription elongation factor GreB [Zymomonas mobilis]AEI37423.1 transcription elongation factor GreB [Zymomonas mobilis subsp. pomaceae ATCC 29192]MDX5948790.1 transcription elongation factor GreB [Zymomonas mobilis subsp. pomaceae]GEB88598.1 transcription elongation factor GreB [Zymomonas mobilis subsp. pomaceae]